MGTTTGDTLSGRYSDPQGHFDKCNERFANPAQEDSFPSPLGRVGDRCETIALNIRLSPNAAFHESPGGLGYHGISSCKGDTYSIDLGANAHQVSWDGSSEELRGGTSVESCSCETLNSQGTDWALTCWDYCLPYQRAPWNPIRATKYEITTYEPGYTPVDGKEYRTMHAMARDRTESFQRPGDVHHRRFVWDWRNTVQYYFDTDPNAVIPMLIQDTPQVRRAQKIRVSWPWDSDRTTFDQWEVSFSPGVVFIHPPTPGCESRYLNLLWQDLNPVYLPPAEVEEVRLPGAQLNPIPRGWAVLPEALDGENVLVTFERSLAEPSSIKPFTYLPGSAERVNLSAQKLCSGQLDTGLLDEGLGVASAVFAYQRPRRVLDGLGAYVEQEPARLWVGLVGTAENRWMTLEQVFGQGALPDMVDANLVFDSRNQRLFMLGDEWLAEGGVAEEPGDPSHVPNVLYLYDFSTASSTRLGPMESLGDTTGYSMSYDPAKGRALIFGGTVDGQDTGRLWSLDLNMNMVTLVSDGDDPSLEIARSHHGAYLDPVGRKLYVYGGLRGDVELTDALEYSLLTGAWTELWPNDPEAGGPGPRQRPLVYLDRRTRKLWVAGGGADIEPSIRPWELDLQRSSWSERVSFSAVPPAEPNTSERTFSTDSRLRFMVRIDDHAPLPVEPRLLEITSEDVNLELWVEDAQGRIVGSSRGPTETKQYLLLGQPGQRYLAEVRAGPGYEEGKTSAVTFRDRPATLTLAHTYSGLSNVRALTVVGSIAYVARGMGITAVDVTNPEAPVVVGSLSTGGLVQEVVPCGWHHLCVAQTYGWKSVQVIDIQDPSNMVVEGGVHLPGLCRSVAVRGHLGYVACGFHGVALLNLLDPAAPVVVDTLDLGGLVVDVKVRRDMLVASLGNKHVKAYRLGNGSTAELVAEVTTDRWPVQAYLSDGRVHVAEVGPFSWLLCLGGLRCGFGSRAEVFALDQENGSLDLISDYDGPWARLPFSQVSGGHVLAPTFDGFKVYRAEPQP